MAIRHSITLSTTEPNNEVGIIKIRQADEQTQMLEVQITENGVPKSYQGLAVYFCAKLGQTAGLGIIEQKLNPEEMTDPTNGKLEYTMRAEDWQILGRQRGYFSFRKMKDEHEFIEQFTTRDFTFDVIKSVYSDGLKEVKKDGSTYVWTIEDMVRLFKEYIATGKTDWEEFVEQNREILESVDPGGIVLRELLDARKPFGSEAYATLGERLDSEKAEVDTVSGQLTHIKNAHLTSSVLDFEGVDDLDRFNKACEIPFNTVYVPDGEYTIDGELKMAQGVTLYGSGNATLNYTSDDSLIAVNQGCTVDNIKLNVKALFNGDCFEISTRTIENTRLNKSMADVVVKNIRVISPDSYIAKREYEGTVFHIYGDNLNHVTGIWEILIDNITFEGMFKYFARNYDSTGSWVTSVSYKNIYLHSVDYGWFGSKNETTIKTNEYRDFHATVIENVHFQWDNSIHVAYFTRGRKELKNMLIWDWQSETSWYNLSEDYVKNGGHRITVDKVFYSIESDFSVKELPKHESDYYVRKMISAPTVSTYLGNRNSFDQTEYSETYRSFGTTPTNSVPLWFESVMFIATGGAIARGKLSIYGESDGVKDIFINYFKAGGAEYFGYSSTQDITNLIDIYAKNEDLEGGSKKVTLLFKFNYNPSTYSFYSSLSKSHGWDEVVLKRVNSPSVTNFKQVQQITKGSMIPELPSTYTPMLSSEGVSNYIAQKNERIVYKTKNGLPETLPKMRKGRVTSVTTTSTEVTFSDIGTTNYEVFYNSVTGITISNKTSTSFSIKTTTGTESNVSWLVIA